MTRLVTVGWVVLLSVAVQPSLAQAQGKVILPTIVWERMQEELAAASKPAAPPLAVLPGERRLEGSLRKGLLRARLNARFEMKSEAGHVRVPVLDGAASVTEVRLNGQRTSLKREGDMYTVGVDAPGTYTIEVSFLLGKEQDRFARRLRLRLPEAGITRLSLLVPEQEIDARLATGVLERQERTSDGTLLVGYLNGSGLLDLAWTRRLTHRETGPVQLTASSYTIFTAQESLIQGLAVFDMHIVSGEADRFDFVVPSGVEVIRVEGDAVLQWHTDAKQANVVAVLLRYLVDDEARIGIRFQFPVDADKSARLRMPAANGVESMTGLLGVQAPAGLSIELKGEPKATKLQPHELPVELTELAASPLLMGFSFTEEPEVTINIARQTPVKLTSTLIDELQASTVLIEDGSEITKLKLRMRNNTLQYLKVMLPPGAVLTHSLIDGQPVRPAVGSGDDPKGGDEALLFPLRQSERIKPGEERYHEVRVGETLSDLANEYYSDPRQWQQILDANQDQLFDASDVAVGQRIKIPAPAGASVQESSFVIELAYRRAGKPLGALGRVTVGLPQLDVDVMQAVWHVYLPETLAPLRFDSNLAQYSAIRYDHFRRLRDFLQRAFSVQSAWAGGDWESYGNSKGGRYENILRQRKGIYAAEASKKAEGKMVLASFPLVGERYRFKRQILGLETPTVSFIYAARAATPPIRWLALVVSFVLGLLVLRPVRAGAAQHDARWAGRRRRTLSVAAAVLLLLLLVAYYVMGVHRRIIWGIDLALIVTILRASAPRMAQEVRHRLREPWTLVNALTLGNLAIATAVMVLLAFLLATPLLLSTAGLIILVVLWRRATAPRGAPAGTTPSPEVAHA